MQASEINPLMYSLHFTGNLWFLLLIPPGLWILWRQYRGLSGAEGARAIFPRPARLLFALQALALILLAVSLTAPELRRHKVEFHNPTILILRDQSSSFQAGAYLGLGSRYLDFAKTLAETYGARKFDIRIVDFSESAWPVAGFKGGPNPAPRRDAVSLTSLAALADFVDSATVPNLQAAFLFSDGRSNLDSGRASRTWRIPLYPVLFEPDSVAEVQPERVSMTLHPEIPGGRADMEVDWSPVGKAGGGATLRLLKGSKVVLTRKLEPNYATMKSRFSWNPEKSVSESREPIRAVVQPLDPSDNFDPFNDTLNVLFPQGRVERTIRVFRPVRSLDEKGMLGILQAWEGTRVSFFGMEDLGRLTPAAKDQIWVEAGALASHAMLQTWLQSIPAKAVVYSRPGRDGSVSGRNAQVAGLGGLSWKTFAPVAEIKPGKTAAEVFPDEAVRLKDISAASMEAPETGNGTLVEIREGGKRGMFMGRVPLGQGKRAFFFCLPAIWASIFDPQADFATRENIAAFIRAVHGLAAVEDGAVRVSRPSRAYENVPFDLEIRLPEKEKSETGSRAGLIFSITGPSFSKEWPQPSAGNSGKSIDLPIKGVTLARGQYRLELKAGTETLWRDSLSVVPKAALELGRIGFDRAGLEDAASRSGGVVLALSGGTAEPSQVTSMLPNLSDAQVKMEKTQAIRLYNTLFQCLLVLAMLSLSWFLRKKWDFD
ncbi:MAG: hypothetical protein M3Y08_06680 [Fibrobacterota bacterium]|nr:hypothetical protein [Fibrobacterota bacterium]